MLTICLNKQAALQNGMSLDEVLLMLIITNNANLKIAEETLIKKGYITANRDEHYNPIGWRLTNKGSEALNSVILDSDKSLESPNSLIPLATRLKEIFPKGKKEGTQYYWAEGTALIVRRLRLFFKKYGNKYTHDQIIQATEKYVQGFNGNYTYMRLLKYFIFKEKVGVGGDVEGDSELISYIENAGQEETLKEDWTSNIN